MDALAWLGGTGFVDAVIALTLVEALVLWIGSRRHRGIDFEALAPSLASGLMLMVALRMALADARWPAVVLPVAMAGLAHAWDLRRRWTRARPGPQGAVAVAASTPRR